MKRRYGRIVAVRYRPILLRRLRASLCAGLKQISGLDKILARSPRHLTVHDAQFDGAGPTHRLAGITGRAARRKREDEVTRVRHLCDQARSIRLDTVCMDGS